MRTDSQRQLRGRLLSIIIALAISSCHQTGPAPKIEVCILDGFGGGDCVETDGSQLFRTPSMMKNYWATNQNDETTFAQWCFGSTPSATRAGMAELRQEIYRP